MASIEQRHFEEIAGLSEGAFEASWASGSRFYNGALSWGDQTASWQTVESGVAKLHRSGPAIDSLTLASRWMLDLVITERFENHSMLTVISVAAPPRSPEIRVTRGYAENPFAGLRALWYQRIEKRHGLLQATEEDVEYLKSELKRGASGVWRTY